MSANSPAEPKAASASPWSKFSKTTEPVQVTGSGREADAHTLAGELDEGGGALKAERDLDGAVVDAVWGRLDADAPNYRGLSWWGAAIIQTKIQVSRGAQARS